MNINLLHEKLIRAAKQMPISEDVPFAFEKRILARVRAEQMVDGLTLWAKALWRAAIPCTVLMIVLGFLTVQAPAPSSETAQAEDLSAELETTLMASVSLDNNFDW